MRRMTTPKMPLPEAAPTDELSDAEFLRLHGIEPATPEEEAAIDAWEERNKDVLNESIRQGRENCANGNYSSLEDVMARVRARLFGDKI
jgi:hypothetical protein